MPGSYAHITLANTLRLPQVLSSMADFPAAARTALNRFIPYCELGAVSPDYPYLVIESAAAQAWADIMHYHRNGDMVKAGIEALRGMEGDERDMCLAWLLGFASHLGMDTTVHPVVELTVGDYDHHKAEHRVCEMNQDVYIFQRMNLGGVSLSDHLGQGIRQCDMAVIGKLWSAMLKTTHPAEYETNPPDFEAWHHHFEVVVEDIAAHGSKYLLFGRHALTGSGFLYPDEAEINRDAFIDHLPTPANTRTYDWVFDYAVDRVSLLWRHISTGIFTGDTAYLAFFNNWNLDKGVSEEDFAATGHGKFIFWEGSL